MALCSKILFGVFGVLLNICIICTGSRVWDFEALDAHSVSSDPSKLNLVAKVEWFARGQSGLSILMDWKFDPDDTTDKANLQIYRSQSGRKDDYSLTPYHIPWIPLNVAIQKYYNDIVYRNVKHCSNFPDVTENFVPPFPQNTYEMKQCVVTTNGFPDFAPIGYYKLLFKIQGQVNVTLMMIFKVTRKMA